MTVTRRALLLGLLAGVAGCGRDGSGPRALSAEEAERLALIRLTNYERGTSAFMAAVPVGSMRMRLDGRVDWPGNVGYALVTVAGGPAQLLQWTPARIAVLPDWEGPLPDRPPAAGWLARTPVRTASFDAALLLILALAHDRPENAELLRQNGARRLRTVTRDGERLTVFQGPDRGRIRYWVDADGELRRIEAQVGGDADTIVDLLPGPAPAVIPVPGLTT